MSLFGQTKRHNPGPNPRRSPLPGFNYDEKRYSNLAAPGSSRWFTFVYVPIPSFTGASPSEPLLNGNGHYPTNAYNSSKQQRRYVRLPLPIPPRLYARFRPKKPVRLLIGVLFIAGVILFALGFRKKGGQTTWSPPFVDADTLVLAPEELAMIWEWEILSGHYATLQQPPENIPLAATLINPAVPETLLPTSLPSTTLVAYHQRTASRPKSQFIGSGPDRNYISAWDGIDSHPGFPARPAPGSVIDLDLVLETCDFGSNKYVRDCLEYLRIAGGLDNGRRVRRGNYLGTYKQIYFEGTASQQQLHWTPRLPPTRPQGLSRLPLSLAPPQSVPATYDSREPCDPDHPRIFHMFWAGPFTDKPYMAVISFLFTQNLGLDKPLSENSDIVRGTCRPQFWVWINPGPAAAVLKPSARREMFEQLATNPWSAPFLHDRFRDVVKFRMWNTTEQLDGVAELKDHWRAMPIFNSGGDKYEQPMIPEVNIGEVVAEADAATAEYSRKKKDAIYEKVGSSSASDYDRLSVILSDMARFVLTHRFGGIYLDADTIFLRDWEELWNYRGQFAYRWSWHAKYNTAVMKLHKGSALGTFLFKTALENGLDFHPMIVSRYLKDAGLEKLLFRVPDALFDPAWLNMERYQRERPPFPYFPEFSVFFSNDKFDTAGAQPLGFDGFFRGAFSYHFHNSWWLAFDPSRNFPDLGQRFVKGEQVLRDAQKQLAVVANAPADTERVTSRDDMDDEVDLSWATVLKRTFEAYLRNERPNAYGEELSWVGM